jgi:DNA-binding NtrC family response regulator
MNKSIKILVVDDELILRESVGRILSKDGYSADFAENGAQCLKKLESNQYDLVLLDLALPDVPGQKLLVHIKAESPGTAVVIITGHATIENAIQTLTKGASDFLAKPFSPNELRAVLRKIGREISLTRENELLRRKVSGLDPDQMIIGESKAMMEVLDLVQKVAPTDSTILILGESGTGKEVIARAIHDQSRREEKEFVPIDCTSLVETLLESELFGHVKGSFTGAFDTKHGYFELARGGTMFFDEIGNLPLAIQAKLLRALQTRRFNPVGSTQPITADVRILAATNQDLEKLIEAGKFREDLFYRLHVVPIRLPPLRERRSDVPLLTEYFVKRYNRRRTVPVRTVSPEAMALLQSYHWPGNVRELENTIERALILAEGDELSHKALPIQFGNGTPLPEKSRPTSLAEMEREHILYVLKMARKNRSQAAKLLGVDRKTLYNKLKRYEIE